jgi:hypothetical protein
VTSDLSGERVPRRRASATFNRSTPHAIKKALINPEIANITSIGPTDAPWINDHAKRKEITKLSGMVR